MSIGDVNEAVGKEIARRRRALRLSLAQLADECGVSLQQIHKYETAQNTMPAPMLLQLAQCLDVPVSYFFEAIEADPAATAPPHM